MSPSDRPPARRPTHASIRWWLLAGVPVVVAALVWGVTVLTRAPDRAGTDLRQAIARGRADFAGGSCISCHALYPISSAGGAIDLTHEGRRHTFVWLQHEIRFPHLTAPTNPTRPGRRSGGLPRQSQVRPALSFLYRSTLLTFTYRWYVGG